MYNNGRRHFLYTTLLASGLSFGAVSSRAIAGVTTAERRLIIRNMHTGEKLDVVYWQDGRYRTDETNALSRLMRDHRRDEIHSMDVSLLDLLYNLHSTVDANHGIELFSGYRSPKTNQALRENNKGVAKGSLHMQGKAADIRLPGVRLHQVCKAALALRSGGVGYYEKSGFLHVDTGRVRRWGSG